MECSPIYRMQFLVKDQSSQMNKNFYRILLYTGVDEESKMEESNHRGDGDQEKQGGTSSCFFKDVEPCNLYHHDNEEKRKKLEQQVSILTTFNVWVDAILQRYENYFLIRDTEITMNFNA